MRKVLLTGSNGFIGKNLYEALLKRNYSVFKLNHLRQETFLFEGESDMILKTTKIILSDFNTELSELLDKYRPDVVFHVGACSDSQNTNLNEVMMLNYEFTKIVSDLCFQKNIEFIYSSSASVYGHNGRMPSTLYGWSKYLAENYVIKNGGIALRYFNVYGKYEEHKGKMASMIYQGYLKKIENTPVALKSSLSGFVSLFPNKPERDFVYVDDVVSANLYAYDNYADIPKTFYEVGYGESVTFEEIMEMIGAEYTYTFSFEVPTNYQYKTLSDSRKWMKGWTPKYDIKTGIQEYMEYLKNTHLKQV